MFQLQVTGAVLHEAESLSPQAFPLLFFDSQQFLGAGGIHLLPVMFGMYAMPVQHQDNRVSLSSAISEVRRVLLRALSDASRRSRAF